MASLASGVAVVTGVDPESGPCGMTVTSIASYSAKPPSVIVCVDESTRSYRGMTAGEYFAVHLLNEDQADVARLFCFQGRRQVLSSARALRVRMGCN